MIQGVCPAAGKKIVVTFFAKHIGVSIDRPAAEVYEFASNPRNLPEWATGLGDTLKKVGQDWVAASPMGAVKIKFAGKNKYGVLDHDVTLPSGMVVYNPMRVIPNDEGSELIFTLYRRPDMSEKMFADDARVVRKDMKKLKTLLENRPHK